ncbi:MAG: NRDE family protein [Blastocatellia bacterium]
MCTVTWLRNAAGYELFCNRDERLTRKPAAPPRLRARDGVRYIAPADGDFGGSWIGVNEFGLSLCLLNRYQDRAAKATSSVSRGLLLTELLTSSSSAEVWRRVARTDLGRYQPFTLLAMTMASPAMILDWTGHKLLVDDNGERRLPLTSSSFETNAVIASRKGHFRHLPEISADQLRAYHHSHAPARGPHSVCMHRADARTVSFSHITIRRGVIHFAGYAQPPCEAKAPGVQVSLPLSTPVLCMS